MTKIFDWPPLWLALFLAVAWGISALLLMPVFGRFGDVLGGALVLLGFGLMGLAAGEMLRARTTVVPRRQARQLVISGLFRFSRNPIYLGDSLILLGACLWLDTAPALLLVPLFIWVINTRFITGEEAHLRQTFGTEYENYCAAVRRWV